MSRWGLVGSVDCRKVQSPAITDFREFANRGHSLTIDHGWHEIAQEALDWLKRCFR